ncbi:tetratricopeptide repeat protein [Urbifossiella limnaea]|uniref:Tetratricopeptide repeat protein n=1 Tax=Urbifossiella limnaea TaxID=2528023 RepID=A0A517XUH4_9BACT|nr:tetratricopeptide repeat protein [Urbifossiella limnaea]QDU21152.1 Tetratricopeptide repeat protein [Urbifossiella limnaea]
MSPGLFAGLLLLAPPDPPREWSPAHRDAVARYGAALLQSRRDRLLTAAAGFEKAAKDDPAATEPLMELVRIYSQSGREPDAVRAARTVLERDPANTAAGLALARLLFGLGELGEAATVAKGVAGGMNADATPERVVTACRDLGTILEKANDAAGAADALGRARDVLIQHRKRLVVPGGFSATEADTALADCHERIGKALVAQKKADAAAESFRAAHAIYADSKRLNDASAAARLDWNLSGALAAKGEPAAALRHLDAFLRLRPQAVEPYERLADLLRQANRPDDVLPLLRGQSAADPRNLPLQAVLAAESARVPGSRAEADDLFARLGEQTNDPKIVRAVVRSHVQTGRPGRVLNDFDTCFKTLKDRDEGGSARVAERDFAAERTRVLGELLRAEAGWANAVVTAGADDLAAGRKHEYGTTHVLGVLAARHGRIDLAVVQFRQAVAAAPRDTQPAAYGALIDALWRARKPADVAAVCREGLRVADGVAPAYFHFHLAYALAELGDVADALAAADRAITMAGDADRLTVRLRKLTVLKVLGRWDESIALGRRLLDEFDAPADRERTRYALAGAYWGAKREAEAEAELRAILDRDPDHAGACNDLGYHLADRNRSLEEAERLVRRAVARDRLDRRRAGDVDPDNPAYLDSLAWVLFRRDKLPEARALLERVSVIPEGAADPVVWDHLGDVCFRLDDKPAAKAAWERAAALYPTDHRGRRDGRLDEVRRKLRRVP